MEALAKVNYRHQPLLLSLHHHRSSLPRSPISSLSFRTPQSPLSSPSLKPLFSSRSSSSSIRAQNPKTPKPHHLIESPKGPNLISFSLLRSTFIAGVTVATLFLSRFNLKPLIAAPISAPPVSAAEAEAAGTSESISDEERERTLEEHLGSHPDDVDALRALMEVKIKARKIPEAIGAIERLIELEPNDAEWPLLNAHMHCYIGELELAKMGFNEILAKDPFRVEAYHGLVMAASQSDSGGELKEIEKMIDEAIKTCKREKKREDLRDFKLLIAQIRVIDGNYNEALKVYQELVKEEPRDFRPYLCQGIIYKLLRKEHEAEMQFQKYRRLVPKGHPYARYFDDTMIATKVFAQKVENERAASRS